MSQNYIIDNLKLSDLKEGGKIIIPSFQRGLVWSKEHRKEFISTIRTGDPFGVILVYKDNDKYILVDGLQRLSTLKAYMDRPLDFIDEKDQFIDEQKLDDLIKTKFRKEGFPIPSDEVLSKNKRIIKKRMLEIIKSKDTLPSGQVLWRELVHQIGYDIHDYDITEKFLDFYDSFKENLKLPDILIHAIVYTGPKEQLPTVFNNLNTGSVTLTKYEIFASIWSQNKIKFTDDDIIEKVYSKYDKLKKSSSFEVDTDENMLREDGLTLFEYCYAFSEILNDDDQKYSFLFSGEKKSTDPTGFDLLALACGLDINKSQKLCEKQYLGGCDHVFLQSLKNSLVECTRFVAEALRDWIYDIKGVRIKNDSLYQIYHMIISVFKNLYKLDLTHKTIVQINSVEVNAWKNKFNKYAYKHYLNDVLSLFWSKNRQVSDLTRLLTDGSINRYTNNISKEKIRISWLEFEEDNKGKTSSRNIDNSAKLVLNYYYKLLIKDDANRQQYFRRENGYLDIEHIVPVNKFNKEVATKVSISAIGNLCYLPVKDNRSKRDKTIYQYAEDRPSLTYNDEFLKIIDYPSRTELDFIDFSDDEFINNYNKFIKERSNRIQNKLVDMLSNH